MTDGYEVYDTILDKHRLCISRMLGSLPTTLPTRIAGLAQGQARSRAVARALYRSDRQAVPRGGAG